VDVITDSRQTRASAEHVVNRRVVVGRGESGGWLAWRLAKYWQIFGAPVNLINRGSLSCHALAPRLDTRSKLHYVLTSRRNFCVRVR